MKKIIYLLIIIPTINFAQTVNQAQVTTSPGSLLEFASGTTNGIILPAVDNRPANPANGTFVLDRTDGKVKVFERNSWVELSPTGNITNLVGRSGTVENGKSTVIGAYSSPADGVLVLESTGKALVLPKIASPHLNVRSPYPGMICFDTDRKALAVFNGTIWSYWK